MAASNQAASPSSQPITTTESSPTTAADNYNNYNNKTTTTNSSDKIAATAAAVVESPVLASAASIPQGGNASSSTTIPTYSDTQNSPDYQIAKELLNQGSFEAALETIAAAIEQTITLLRVTSNNNTTTTIADDDDDDDCDIRLHESLAPWHYLYGTTLLYSIEESSEDAQGMIVGDSRDIELEAAAGVDDEEHESYENGDDAMDYPVEEAKQQVEVGQPHDDGAEQNQDDVNDQNQEVTANGIAEPSAEDLQIAWENLETSRLILVRLLEPPPDQNTFTNTNIDRDALLLDLAQIHLRLGDLQRMNGRYVDAIQDYTTSLTLREQQQKAAEPQRAQDRKLADLHYHLAITYMTARAATPNTATDQSDPDDDPTVPPLDDATKQDYRSKGLFHFLCCGKAISGQIALMCGVKDVDSIFQTQDVSLATGSGKTTGLERDQETEHASNALANLRQQVELLTLPQDEALAAKVHEMRELLKEIQESIDTATEDEKGLQIVSEMKAEIQAAAECGASIVDGVITDGSILTTTIGFGAQPEQADATATISTAVAAEQQQTRVMMVKKKRKVENTGNDKNSHASKQAKSE